MKKLRVYLLIISLAFLGFKFEKKIVYTKIPKSNGRRRIWTTYIQFACISLCSHELRAPIFFIYLVVLEGLKNKIKDFLSPYDYRWSTPTEDKSGKWEKDRRRQYYSRLVWFFQNQLFSLSVLCFHMVTQREQWR